MSIKSREDAARRRLKAHGYQMRKTPAASSLRWHDPGYMVINDDNRIVLGGVSRGYEATLESLVSPLFNQPSMNSIRLR